MLILTYLTTNPLKHVFELIMPSLNHHHKTSHYPLQVRAYSFWGRSPLCPPLPGKVIKLSFSTSPQTLSPRFTSAPVYREDELSVSQNWWDSEEFSGKLMTMLFSCITKRKLKLIKKKQHSCQILQISELCSPLYLRACRWEPERVCRSQWSVRILTRVDSLKSSSQICREEN